MKFINLIESVVHVRHDDPNISVLGNINKLWFIPAREDWADYVICINLLSLGEVFGLDEYNARHHIGILHRTDGPAVIWSNGDMAWFLHGKPHRIDGPAIMNDGGKYMEWYLHGKLHRTDGPAIITNNGYKEFWVRGKRMTREEFLKHFDDKT